MDNFLTYLHKEKMTKMDQHYIILDETGCILNEKMMPDVTIKVPDLELANYTSDINVSTKKLPDLAPTNPPIPVFSKKRPEASPYLVISLETSHL
jgi:hypothetical protein